MKNLAIIPARSGSKRLKHKNIKLVAGHPLMYYQIECAKQVKEVDKIIVATDSEHYAQIAKSLGAEVIMRPPEISGPDSKVEETLLYVINELEKQGKFFDNVILLQPVNPLNRPEYIKKAIDILEKDKKYKSVVTYRNFRGFFLDDPDLMVRPMTQSKQPRKLEAGCVWVTNIEALKKERNRICYPYAYFEVPEIDSFEIDTYEDFIIVEALLKERMRGNQPNKLKILFINPVSINRDALPIPPLGILYLAAYIREKGYQDIKVIDNNFYNYPLEELEQEIKKHDIIAVSGTTSQFKQAADISKIAKKNNKISIMGGPHTSSLPEEVLQNSQFDFVVIGEGEITLYELLEAVDKQDDYEKIKGVMFWKNKEIVKTEERKFIEDLDTLPFPARDLIPLLKYGTRELKRFEGQYTHMMTGRGCISKCTFCSSPLMWKYYRMMSAKKVFEEMMLIYNKYGIKNIHFQDDSFTISKKRLMDLCDLIIQSKIPFKWSCLTRPDRVDIELLKKMKEAGCVQIEYGVESGDSRILESSKKGYTKEQIKKAFKLAKEAGIARYGFFIVGLPGETIFSWLKSMRFAKQLDLDGCVWTVLVPFPGTEIFHKRLVKILNPDYTYWLYKQPVIKVGYFGPTSLKIMRWIADKYINGFRNTGTYKEGIGKRLREINE